MVYEPRPAWSLEEVQGRFDHPVLESGVIRDSKRTPELEGHPERPRWLDLLGVLADEADLRRGNALFFNVVGEPAYGARAGRSNRDQ